jgi:hypothetical protein
MTPTFMPYNLIILTLTLQTITSICTAQNPNPYHQTLT